MNLEAIRKRLAKALRPQSYPQPQPTDELLEILDRKRFTMSRRGFLGLSVGIVTVAAIPFNRVWFIPKETPLVNLATVAEQSAVDPMLARFIFNTHVQFKGERETILRQSGKIMPAGSKWFFEST